jgi:multiple sugar transport system permease protein
MDVGGQVRSLVSRRALGDDRARTGWAFVLPALCVVTLLAWVPVLLGIDMSLRAIKPASGIPDHYVGLANYQAILSNPSTITIALRTLGYTLVVLTLQVVVGLGAALVLNEQFRGRGVLLALAILPWALPSVVRALMWQRFFAAPDGFLNVILEQANIIDQPHIWLAGGLQVVIIIGLVYGWGAIPLSSLIFLAGLQGIPSDIYEAAAADGASRIDRFRLLTLPLLRPSVGIALGAATIGALSIFDVIYVLNGSAIDTRSISMEVYLTAFRDLDFGGGVALAVLLSLATATIVVFQVFLSRRSD